MNCRPVVRHIDGTRPGDAPRRFAPRFVLTAASHLDKMKYFCKGNQRQIIRGARPAPRRH
jgi:hypothetical protein